MRTESRQSWCSAFVLASLVILTGVQSWAQEAPGAGIFALQTMLSDKSSETRIKAAEGLGRIGGLRSVLILRRGLSDKTVEVRVAVVEALGFVGGGA